MTARSHRPGDIVYLKFRSNHIPLQPEQIGRITKIEGTHYQAHGTVQWYDSTTTEHPLHDLISITKKLTTAQQDVTRFTQLITTLENQPHEQKPTIKTEDWG